MVSHQSRCPQVKRTETSNIRSETLLRTKHHLHPAASRGEVQYYFGHPSLQIVYVILRALPKEWCLVPSSGRVCDRGTPKSSVRSAPKNPPHGTAGLGV